MTPIDDIKSLPLRESLDLAGPTFWLYGIYEEKHLSLIFLAPSRKRFYLIFTKTPLIRSYANLIQPHQNRVCFNLNDVKEMSQKTNSAPRVWH